MDDTTNGQLLTVKLAPEEPSAITSTTAAPVSVTPTPNNTVGELDDRIIIDAPIVCQNGYKLIRGQCREVY